MAGFAHNITAKAFVGFLVLGVVFGVGTYLIYDRLHDLDPAVQRIREPNKTVTLWRETNKNSNSAVTHMRRFLLTSDTTALRQYEEKHARIFEQIDSLRVLAGGDEERRKRADSLGELIEDKLEESALDVLILSDNSNMGIAIDNAVQQLAILERKRIQQEEQRREEDKEDIDNSKKPSDSAPAVKAKAPKEKEGVFQRMFGKRKSKNADTSMSIETIASMLDSIIADSTVAADAPEVAPPDFVQDTLNRAMAIANDLTRAKTEDFEAREARLKEELSLLEQRRITDSLITELGIRMTKAENEATANLISNASEQVRRATSNIIAIQIIGAVLLIMLFTVLIRSDVKRSSRLQQKMKEARLAAEQLARTREEFAANMSHEIRGPLNSIMGISEQLSKSPGAGNQKLVEGLVSASQHLLGLINPVLDVTRLNSGKIEFEIQPFEVRESLSDVQRAFRISAAEKVIGLDVLVDPDVPKIVLGDDVRLRQILFNLVGNAIKFTDRGSVIISCEKADSAPEGKHLLIFKVKDTGIGIEPTAINRIFDEYAQADSSITRKFGGTGLGLSISRKLVEQQNGRIQVKSTPGEGSEFSFEIPFEAVKGKNEQPAIKTEQSQQFKGKHILICDDDEMNRMLAAMIIANHGGQVTECGDGEEVIELVSKNKYDLLVLDINLPKMDGKATVAELRLLGKRLPVIAVTGNAHEENQFRTAGFDGIIIKPYQEAELLSTVNQFIGTPVNEKKLT